MPLIFDAAGLMNRFTGIGGCGRAFPGSVVPFGMTQLSPDTGGALWLSFVKRAGKLADGESVLERELKE